MHERTKPMSSKHGTGWLVSALELAKRHSSWWLRGKPGVRRGRYYCAFLIDYDGNNIEAGVYE
jgi:hypothetical protein